MSAAQTTAILAPLGGWSTALDEAPDEVFATRILGDGVAIDPTEGIVRSPCDGQLIAVAGARHAVTVRSAGGCEILMHVGIDTVALAGVGFELHLQPPAAVRAGDKLLSFDLDFVAQRAKSALTPIIITAESGFRIAQRILNRGVAAGELLMEVAPAGAAVATEVRRPAAAALSRSVNVLLEHGIHARPAALLVASLKNLASDVRVAVRGREANARSTVALMALGVQHGERVEIRASGPDAAIALEMVAAALGTERPGGAAAARRAPEPTVVPAAARTRGLLSGVIASRGLAVGQAFKLARPELTVPEVGRGAAAENALLDTARALVRSRLERRAGAGGGAAPAEEIAAAHLELLEDPELLGGARALIAQGKSAGFAWRSTLRSSAAALGTLEDPRLRERADDLLDLESQVLAELAGGGAGAAPELPPEAIVLARELLPSQLSLLDSSRLAGICMAAGGPTSHAALIAAAMGLPALVALGPELLSLADGNALVLDAERGVLETEPTPARLEDARAEVARRLARRSAAQREAQREGRTADGVRIEVFANVGSVAEAHAAVANGAEGCGLLRTEFLFLDRQSPPSEAEQTAVYQEIADALGERPLTIRTLDAGGDKPIAYLPLPSEENPALGLRGVRTGFAHPELLRTQLRAVLAMPARARCRLLLPMITDVEEVRAVRAMLGELDQESGRGEPLAVGVMIETPASALLAEHLVKVADFLSIGTNDLTQYTLAMDRGHPVLAHRLDALHPAVLRLIARAAEAAQAAGRHAAVCGGLASEPLAAAILIGLGVQELSALPSVIAELKARIGSVTLADCRALARAALAAESAAEVRALAARALPVSEETVR
ncbi:MAG TPA: phosphoenolpyruvate--protein phosphotransferase [Steroidobacteraceae bacterium]|nr:phosphoenolpyruvate--protein phosphotransferase [Steroidobacteraceae bacterium]